jgi:radical SAM protein with 4Fe4S-binding SPASM domain
MDGDQCFEVVAAAGRMGVSKVAFSGGEPLVWRPIHEAVNLAAGQGMEVTVYTSGNIADVGETMRALRMNGAARCVFSVHGHEPGLHESVTTLPGSFAATLRAIEASRDAGLMTELHFVPMANNYLHLEDIAALGGSLGVERLSILRFVPQGRGQLLASQGLNRLQHAQLKRAVDRLRREGYTIRTGSPWNFLGLNEQPKCCAGIDRIIIGPDLAIYPCDAFKQVGAIAVVGSDEFSSLHSASLEECWEKSPYLEAVRRYPTSDFAPECVVCPQLEKCCSGCLAQKFLVHGDLAKTPDPNCMFAEQGD